MLYGGHIWNADTRCAKLVLHICIKNNKNQYCLGPKAKIDELLKNIQTSGKTNFRSKFLVRDLFICSSTFFFLSFHNFLIVSMNPLTEKSTILLIFLFKPSLIKEGVEFFYCRKKMMCIRSSRLKNPKKSYILE